MEGPFGGADICGVAGPLTLTPSGPGESVAWDGAAAGGIAGGSIRWGGGGGGPSLFSKFGASPGGGRSGARSALGPVGGRIVRPGGIADLSAVGAAEVFAGIRGAAGAVGTAGPDEAAGVEGAEAVGGAAEGAEGAGEG